MLDRHGGEDLDLAALHRAEPPQRPAGDGGEQRGAGAAGRRRAVPAHQRLAAGQLGGELHGRGAVVHDDDPAGVGTGQQQLRPARERVADDQPVGGAQPPGQGGPGAGAGRSADLAPQQLVALVAGEAGHPQQLAPGGGVAGREHDDGQLAGGERRVGGARCRG
ncbi:hypothetical protein HCN56_04190, partial [Streptomyces lonarensis]|nr:hypothetical protein [Streptomyces lonarensis]